MKELQYQLDLLKAMNQKLVDKDIMYNRICESAEVAFIYYSFDKMSYSTSGAWSEYFDFELTNSTHLTRLSELVDDSYQLALYDVLYLEKSGKELDVVECQLRDKLEWFVFKTNVKYDKKHNPIDKVIYIRKSTKLHSQSEELAYMAYYDGLTGLYNRNYFVRLLSDYVRIAEATNNTISVMVIDIDGFRKVNEGYGIIIGDELVQQFGAFLKEICVENVIACHLHSDVFCIAIYDPHNNKSVEEIYNEICLKIKKPLKMSTGENIPITVKVGVADYPEAAQNTLELINYAEIVVYKSRLKGENRLHYFRAPILDDFLNSIELENRLKSAVSKRDFYMCYQPQYYSGNHQLRGVEALIRWRDSGEQVVGPDVFIPIAEKNGTIVPIGKWVLEECIRQYSIWKKQFGFPFIMSINVSALQYKKEDFAEHILGTMRKYDVKLSEIELEITEGVLIDDFKEVSQKLKMLRNYGIRISLDDFGTGFSSLSYLKHLPIDTLKIDKSFIDTVLTDSSTRVITESIIHMVKTLGFESIAEGVESEQQSKYLHAIGCDVMQGYLFGKPLLPDEFESLIIKGN